MSITSAGLLLFRGSTPAVFLVHPGGPYWARKDDGAWSVPKGVVEPHEDAHACAWREFREETGLEPAVSGREWELGLFRLPSGKHLRVWTVAADCDPASMKSNLFEMEWPPRSGQIRSFPEVDRAGWFDPAQALIKIGSGQRTVLHKFYADYGKTIARLG